MKFLSAFLIYLALGQNAQAVVQFQYGKPELKGKLISAPNNHTFTAYGGSFIKNSNGYHLFFCASGKPYDNMGPFQSGGPDPQWNHDGQKLGYGDRILYAHSSDGVNYTVKTKPGVGIFSNFSNPDPMIQSPANEIGSCQSSVVYYNADVGLGDGYGPAYYLFYESGLPETNQIAIYVARSKNIDGPYLSWTGTSWAEIKTNDPSFATQKPIIVPINKFPELKYAYCTSGGFQVANCTDWSSYSGWLLQNPSYGAGMPIAVVANNKINLWYFDSSVFAKLTPNGKDSSDRKLYQVFTTESRNFYTSSTSPISFPVINKDLSTSIYHYTEDGAFVPIGDGPSSGADFVWDAQNSQFIMFVKLKTILADFFLTH